MVAAARPWPGSARPSQAWLALCYRLAGLARQAGPGSGPTEARPGPALAPVRLGPTPARPGRAKLGLAASRWTRCCGGTMLWWYGGTRWYGARSGPTRHGRLYFLRWAESGPEVRRYGGVVARWHGARQSGPCDRAGPGRAGLGLGRGPAQPGAALAGSTRPGSAWYGVTVVSGVRWCVGTVVRWYGGAAVRWCGGAAVWRYGGLGVRG